VPRNWRRRASARSPATAAIARAPQPKPVR
jgi:hypothetical protein